MRNEISTSIEERRGLKQDDILASLLFIIVLEKSVRTANLRTNGNVFIHQFVPNYDICGQYCHFKYIIGRYTKRIYQS